MDSTTSIPVSLTIHPALEYQFWLHLYQIKCPPNEAPEKEVLRYWRPFFQVEEQPSVRALSPEIAHALTQTSLEKIYQALKKVKHYSEGYQHFLGGETFEEFCTSTLGWGLREYFQYIHCIRPFRGHPNHTNLMMRLVLLVNHVSQQIMKLAEVMQDDALPDRAEAIAEDTFIPLPKEISDFIVEYFSLAFQEDPDYNPYIQLEPNGLWFSMDQITEDTIWDRLESLCIAIAQPKERRIRLSTIEDGQKYYEEYEDTQMKAGALEPKDAKPKQRIAWPALDEPLISDEKYQAQLMRGLIAQLAREGAYLFGYDLSHETLKNDPKHFQAEQNRMFQNAKKFAQKFLSPIQSKSEAMDLTRSLIYFLKKELDHLFEVPENPKYYLLALILGESDIGYGEGESRKWVIPPLEAVENQTATPYQYLRNKVRDLINKG